MIAELFLSAYFAQPRRVAYQLPPDIEAAVVKNAPKKSGIFSRVWCLAGPWLPGKKYTAGTPAHYKGRLFLCVQTHTGQAGWTPDTVPALWREVYKAAPGQPYPAWHQPSGAHDAYRKGDTVIYNNKVWISTTDNNVWAPGVAGWTEKKGKEK